MFRVLATIGGEHDGRLVFAAVALCLAAIICAFKTLRHAEESGDLRRNMWLVLASACTAAGAWSAQYLSLLGYDAGAPVGYDFLLVYASLAAAFAGCLGGYWVAISGNVWFGELWEKAGREPTHQETIQRQVSAVLGGLVMAVGFVAMHVIGMRALVVPASISWGAEGTMLSLAMAFTLTPAALFVLYDNRSAYRLWSATGLLVLAICGQYFSGASAMMIAPNSALDVASPQSDKVILTLSIAVIAVFVLAAGVVALLVERLKGEINENMGQLRAANLRVINLNVALEESMLQLKEAQAEALRKEKLSQLGQLTATVAHEIRNPLGAVKTATFIIERKLKDKTDGLESQFTRISNGISRCDAIISELLDFTRSRTLELKSVNVDDWVRATVEEEAKALPPAVNVAVEAGLEDVESAFDHDRMRRVLINLLSNASEAMVGKGLPGDKKTDDPRIRVTTRQTDDRIEIEIKDNGPGISPENLAKIREPLFTTKSFGVGLGIPAIEKILLQHGGGLQIESTLGDGACITAWFPVNCGEGSVMAAA